MATTDRLNDALSSKAIKAPCKAATTANIDLSGLQAVDGVSLSQDDRVLVKNQTTGSENGVYVVDTGNWERAPDFDGNLDVAKGSLVPITDGTTNASTYWRITTNDPITIGTTSIAFAQVTFVSVDNSTGRTEIGLPGGATIGNLIAGDGTDYSALSVGTNDQVLTADSAQSLGMRWAPLPSVATGIAAWVNFTGTGTVTINASNNVSSVTDNGTGDYTVNFTTAFSNANYAIIGGVIGQAIISATNNSNYIYDQDLVTVSSFPFQVWQHTNPPAIADAGRVNLAFIGS